MMRPTWAYLSNSLPAMPEGWDTPGRPTVAELLPVPPLNCRTSSQDRSAPQAVLPPAPV
jgi:hypothetical protein